ncbi:MAG: hypothetical protein R2856_07365 [Caldilineaceae bacterium]
MPGRVVSGRARLRRRRRLGLPRGGRVILHDGQVERGRPGAGLRR